jgi:predicted glycosyltransferase
LTGLLKEVMVRIYRLWKLHRKHRFDVAFGTSPSIAHLTLITLGRVRSFNFGEDDDDIVPLHAWTTYPFTTKVINPDCLRFSRWKAKRVLYSSYHELAYLHPDNFTPDERILEKYGLQKGRYVIFRLVSLTAHHDGGAKGISPELKHKMLSKLHRYDIIESMEGKAGNKVEPWDMHHLLAFTKMIISDSQTMTVEAAMLGVPALRINTFIDKSTVIGELEHRYRLAYGYYPDRHEEILATLTELLANRGLENEWQKRRQHLLSEKIDFNRWMIDYFEHHILQQ